jgi:hypothetical protein
MNEQELMLDMARVERGNSEKVQMAITNKLKRLSDEEVVGEVEEPKRMTYEEAQERGNTLEMIKIKSGFYQKLDKERELNALLDDTDIVAVSNELNDIGDKSTEHKSLIDNSIEKAKEQIKADYEEKTPRPRKIK